MIDNFKYWAPRALFLVIGFLLATMLSGCAGTEAVGPAIGWIVLAFVGGGCLGVLCMALMTMAADPLDVE